MFCLGSKEGCLFYTYTLCSEWCYNIQKLHNWVSFYPFNDHAPLEVGQLLSFCQNVQAWLGEEQADQVYFNWSQFQTTLLSEHEWTSIRLTSLHWIPQGRVWILFLPNWYPNFTSKEILYVPRNSRDHREFTCILKHTNLTHLPQGHRGHGEG